MAVWGKHVEWKEEDWQDPTDTIFQIKKGVRERNTDLVTNWTSTLQGALAYTITEVEWEKKKKLRTWKTELKEGKSC